MTAFVALLRAVNLPGHNKITMADLKGVAARCGLGAPRTLLQSGNLVFTASGKTSAQLETVLEAALGRELGLKTPVVVRSLGEWRAALEHNPFPSEAKDDPGHLVVMALKGKPVRGGLTELVHAIPGREQVKSNTTGRELYLVYPDGIGVSKLTTALIERKIGVTGTARNWNTAQKLLAALEA